MKETLFLCRELKSLISQQYQLKYSTWALPLVCQTVSHSVLRKLNLIPPPVSFMFIWQQKQWMPAQSNHSSLESSWMWLTEEREERMWHVESALSPCVGTYSMQIDKQTHEIHLFFFHIQLATEKNKNKFTFKQNSSYTGRIPQIISAAPTWVSCV